MRKIITLLLTLLIMLSLTACGGQAVDKALQGTWIVVSSETGKPGDDIQLKIIFDNGSVSSLLSYFGTETDGRTGTYEIKEDAISVHWNDNNEPTDIEISYTMDGSTLLLDGYTKE